MVIGPIESGQNYLPLIQQLKEQSNQINESNKSFVDTIKEFISDVNTSQKEAYDLNEKFIKGEPIDLHDVMLATEKAKTNFQLLLELRNKFTDMYQQINRMQV